MANMNTKLRKINKGFVDKIKEDSRNSSNYGTGKKGVDYLEDSGVQPLTLKEQIFKGNDVEVKFLNNSKKKSLKTMQLGVFLNGNLKYVSKKDVFSITTVKYSVIRRKGWRIYCEEVSKDRIIFKNKKDHEKFLGFCTQVRDCVKIQDMFNDLCYRFFDCDDYLQDLDEKVN